MDRPQGTTNESQAKTAAEDRSGTADAPAIIVSRTGEYKPGEWVKSKAAIFIGTFDLINSYGFSLGFRTNWYDAAIELGRPKNFNATADAIASNRRSGWGGPRLNPARYEAELFCGLESRAVIGEHVIAPLEVVNAIYNLRNTGRYKYLTDAGLPGKLILTSNGIDDAHYQLSCTSHPSDRDIVWAVDFTDGSRCWNRRDHDRLSVRACFAELAL